jgi:acyl transferase domain-containing protein
VTPLLTSQVGIAAINGPDAVVVSGAEGALDAVTAHFQAAGRRVGRLRVSHAFHSPLVEPMLADFGDVAGHLAYTAPAIPIVSTVTGQPATAEELCDPAYWVRHARQPVRFHSSPGGTPTGSSYPPTPSNGRSTG